MSLDVDGVCVELISFWTVAKNKLLNLITTSLLMGFQEIKRILFTWVMNKLLGIPKHHHT
jgi:hypothetical protein